MSESYSIYFNSKKEAFAFEIENPICVIESSLWEQYAGTDKWDIISGTFTDITETPEYIEKKRQEQEDKINNLTMTALDFVKVLYGIGISPVKLKEYLDSNLELDQQLKYCQNVYCGVVRQLLPLEVDGKEITDAMVVSAFKLKNGVE